MNELSRSVQSVSESGAAEDNLWLNLLNTTSSLKKVPAKRILLLGGGNDGAKEWITSLKKAVISSYDVHVLTEKEETSYSTYLMDYTYIEWMDPDHGERLAVIEVYLISEHHVSCESFLFELFTPEFLENCLVCILLDWREPWNWLKELYDWVSLVKKSIDHFKSSSEASFRIISDIMTKWEYKIRTYTENASWMSHDTDRNDRVTIPLEEGQFDQPLGLPLICICNHSEHIASIEKDEILKDEHFDFIQQFLRTILMKHGGALYYTSNLYPNTLNNLLYSILDCFSFSPQIYMDINSPPKANVIDRDQIFVPPGWDSWGKIRIIREGFDVAGIAQAWHADLDPDTDKKQTFDAINIFEEVIVNQKKNNVFNVSEIDELVTAMPFQEFLSNQLNIIDTKPQTQENAVKSKTNIADRYTTSTQLNLGGIKLDTDEVDEKLQKLRDMRSESNSPASTPDTSYKIFSKTISSPLAKDQNQNETLANFFQSLLNRKKESA